MDINELAAKLSLPKELKEEDRGMYTVDLPSSDAFNAVYSKLSVGDLFDQDVDEFEMNDYESKLLFFNDDYNIELIGDFEKDIYTINIYEVR